MSLLISLPYENKQPEVDRKNNTIINYQKTKWQEEKKGPTALADIKEKEIQEKEKRARLIQTSNQPMTSKTSEYQSDRNRNK